MVWCPILHRSQRSRDAMRTTWGFKRRNGRVVRVAEDIRWEKGRFSRQESNKQRSRQQQIAEEFAMAELKRMYGAVQRMEHDQFQRVLNSQKPFIVGGVFFIDSWMRWHRARTDTERAKVLADFKAKHGVSVS